MQHRKTRPYTPKTFRLVERFNGRVQGEVLGIKLYSHVDLEIVLRGFKAAYNGRRQSVLNRFSPGMVLRLRLDADPALVNRTYKSHSPGLIRRVPRLAADLERVSHPDS